MMSFCSRYCWWQADRQREGQTPNNNKSAWDNTTSSFSSSSWRNNKFEDKLWAKKEETKRKNGQVTDRPTDRPSQVIIIITISGTRRLTCTSPLWERSCWGKCGCQSRRRGRAPGCTCCRSRSLWSECTSYRPPSPPLSRIETKTK